MAVADDLTVKLPLMGHSLELDALPGQDPAVRYGVIWDVCQQPGDGLGYVVRYVDARTCHILAWMGRGGVVSECDRPISFVMPGIPVLACVLPNDDADAGTVRVRRHGSDELLQAVAFRSYFPSQVGFEPLPARKGADGITQMEGLQRVMGVYTERKMAWRVFVAVSYLALYLLPRENRGRGQAPGTIADVLRGLTAQALPDAIDSLVFRVLTADEGSDDEVSGFERYAARMLDQAGASKLRDIAARHDLGIARLSVTHLFWMRLADDMGAQERQVALNVESCLNRLALVEMSLRASGVSTKLADCRESRCATEDARVMARIADRARQLIESSQEENPYCLYFPAQPLRGGEWDVRTRFIRACESLPLPYRLEYRFDCYAEGGMLQVRIGLPPQDAFPAIRWNGIASRWEDRGSELPAVSSCYALRLAAVVAACAFGTSLGMRQVVVTGCAGQPTGKPLLSLRFERMSFLNRALYRIEQGAIARVGETGSCTAQDVRALLDLLAPIEARMDPDEQGGLQPVEQLQVSLPESRLPLAKDKRYLPASLAHLLHADTVSDLDLEGATDLRELDEVQTAVEDAAESRLLAMARLEGVVERNPVAGMEQPDDIVAAAEAALRGAPDIPGYDEVDADGDTRPVRLAYFPNLFARCLVDVVARREDEAFEAIPQQAYLARSALAKLYLESGDEQACLARLRECGLLAPTSAGMLLESAQVMMAAKRPEEALDLLRQAMRVCVRQQMANMLYAHVGGTFWAMGKPAEALAAFVMARRYEQGQSGFDPAIGQLMQILGLSEMPDAIAAAATLRAQGVPVAPNDEARAALMNAAVDFTDARMFELAWPLVGAIGFDVANDVLALMGEHLHTGLD